MPPGPRGTLAVDLRTVAFLLSLVFVFVIPWEGVFEFPGLGSAAKLIGIMTAACWLASVLVQGRVRTPGPFHVLVALFVLWNGLSILWSADPSSTQAHVVRWVQLLVLVFLLWDLYTTRAAVLAALQAFILGEYVAVSSALSNFAAGDAFYSHYQRFSPSAQSGPDGFGIIVVLGIPVAWYLASSTLRTRWGSLFRFVNYAYIPVALVGIVLSGTRTALIASLLGMAFGLASLTRIRLTARIPVFLLLTTAVLLLLPHVRSMRSFERLGTTYSELTAGDLNERVTIWQEGLAVFPHHPLRGVGANMYRSVNSLGKLAHNSFVSVLVELGMVGFTLFGLILAIAVLEAVRLPKWESRFWITVLAMWAIGACSLTYEHRKATWLFLSLAVASAALTRQRDESARVGGIADYTRMTLCAPDARGSRGG